MNYFTFEWKRQSVSHGLFTLNWLSLRSSLAWRTVVQDHHYFRENITVIFVLVNSVQFYKKSIFALNNIGSRTVEQIFININIS